MLDICPDCGGEPRGEWPCRRCGGTGNDEEALAALAAGFKAPARLKILREAVRPQTVGDLVFPTSLSQPTVSRHLAILLDRGFVTMKREGQRMRVTTNRMAVEAALEAIHDYLFPSENDGEDA